MTMSAPRHRTRPLFAAAATLVAGASLGACANTANRTPFTGVYAPMQQYPRVTVAGELSNFIAVDAPIVEQGDVMKVSVPVRLLSDPGNSSNIQYRVLFFNASGAPARGGAMNWRFVNLPPRNQVFLTGNAMDGDAVDWRCEVRLAK
ncbi:MAG: hypothetical protein U0637_02000 [Phycisphaerales bacterium]